MSEELTEIRRMVGDVDTRLQLHDAKVDANVKRIADAQDRMAEAVEKISDATVAIKVLAEQVRKNGNGGASFRLDRKTITWLIGLGLGGSVALGGGQEVAHRMFHVFAGSQHQEVAAPTPNK
jgi:hypothetical protein